MTKPKQAHVCFNTKTLTQATKSPVVILPFLTLIRSRVHAATANRWSEKEWAITVGNIYAEALHLKEQYHDRLVGRIEKEYPHLYQYVMDQYKTSPSFLIALGQLYKQQTPILNLAALINQLHERYPHHLTWAQAPERYQLLINGLRSEVIEKVVDLDKSYALVAAIQNRVLKSLSGLTAMNQQEVQMVTSQRLSE